MPNRLIDSTSPYLLQHANNPVDWYPWGEEALARAKAEQKPIFLSVGYAACHWCHVMEHQVFERADIAALMNREFINIKVDREERPDLDDLYMLATQLMTGQGGWPMSVWLTPELEPFYAGTYFPPEDGYGRPGFPRLLLALSNSWQNKRGEMLEQAKRVVEAIREHADESAKDGQRTKDETGEFPVRAWVRLAVEQSANRFDDEHGGLGSAPKFPPHQHLQLWLALVADENATGILTAAEKEKLTARITKTLDGMMNGGMYDHVSGGFARYSTDAQWLVPHFEKMLYDNAQLAPIYAAASIAFDRPEYARVARETLDFFIREMMSPEGAFYSSLDADSEGEEGKYYVWTTDDIAAAVPDPDEYAAVAHYFNMTPEGNWHECPVPRASVLAADHRNRAPTIAAAILKMRAYREKRERPRLDDKILTAWNGLMLSALSITGKTLNDPDYLQAAQRLADFLWSHHRDNGRLLRVSRSGPAHTEAFLDDYAFLLNGILDLLAAAPVASHVAHATGVLGRGLIDDFQDRTHGGFFFTGPRHEQLFARMKNAADNATPSPNGVAIRALLRQAALTEKPETRDAALRAVAGFQTSIARRPDYFPTILLGLIEAGIVGPPQESATPAAGTAVETAISFSAARVEQRDSPGPTVAFDVIFRVTIATGFHIQPAEGAEKGMTQTAARLRALGDTPLKSVQWHYPPATNNGYGGSFELRAEITLDDPSPGVHKFRATLIAQACAETYCQEPATLSADFKIDLS